MLCESTNWVQLTGHEGDLIATGTGSVLKVYTQSEAACLRWLQSDILSSYVPRYQGQVVLDGIRYVRMQDLLFEFHNPWIMDCKMGFRTYVEEELSDGLKPKLRPDMYAKMLAVDPNAPTVEEHQQAAVTKLRYMQWRETLSSTAKLGFRIEAIKPSDAPLRCDYKRTRTWDQVLAVLRDFVQSDRRICVNYLKRLCILREALEQSPFFAVHECIGTSLLFAHDTSGRSGIWMIDFGKTFHVTHSPTYRSTSPYRRLDHRRPWLPGNHEDGYLYGLDSIIDLFQHMATQLIH